MNEMQIPAQTSSAPPNLDEQKRDQARHDSLRVVPTLPIPSATKEQLPKKDAGGADQPNTGEAHPIPKVKRDIQVSSAAAVAQTQNPSPHPITGISMPMPFNQPQILGMVTTSMAMQMPMALPIGNPQVQQQVFVPGLRHIPLPPQGMMHQGQSLNFSSPMGRQLPPQLSNVGINITSQFRQQQTGKFGGPRKPVKILHPDTHEELRLDKRTDMHMKSGSSGPRSHPNMPPQTQPIPPYPPAHHTNCYPNSYDASLFFPAPSSLPLTGTQITPGSQASRFNYAVSQGPQTVPFTNRSAFNSVNAESSPSTLGLSKTSHGEKTAMTLDVSSSISDSMGWEVAGMLDGELAPVLTPSSSDVTVKHEEGIQNIGSGSVSVSASGSKDKPVLELNRTKSTVVKKKKREEIRQKAVKADAAGTTSDLYMAYKGPEEKKGTVLSSEITSTNNLKQVPIDSSKEDAVSSDISGLSKAEPDDWEDAADISTPKLETLDNAKQVSGGLKHHGEDGNGVVAKKYSRDFLLKFSEQCIDLPEGIDLSSESFGSGSVSVSASGSKDKPVLELNRTKSTVLKKKKKKEILQKADAAGTTSVPTLEQWGGALVMPSRVQLLNQLKADHPESFEGLDPTAEFLGFVYNSLCRAALHLRQALTKHLDASDFEQLYCLVQCLKRSQVSIGWLEQGIERVRSDERREAELLHLRNQLEGKKAILQVNQLKLKELEMCVEQSKTTIQQNKTDIQQLELVIETTLANMGPAELSVTDLL